MVSLDFELMWGMIDVSYRDNYVQNIIGVQSVIPRLLALAEKYDIKMTFGIVGMITCSSRQEIMSYQPKQIPSYCDSNLQPYGSYFENIGDSIETDRLHYGADLIEMVINNGNHEVGTHTFCHYYCQAPGQCSDQFESDLESAISVLKEKGISVSSIIFPRNQCNDVYLQICKNHGIKSYRGNERNWLHDPKESGGRIKKTIRRALRLIDTYINISGHNCYNDEYMRNDVITNVAASRFLKPYTPRLAFLDDLKYRRIKNDMTYAAKNDLTYHLWWHPHNFGIHQDENFAFLEKIFKHYTKLKEEYAFESKTMSEINTLINNEK